MADAFQFGRLNVWAWLKNLVNQDIAILTTPGAPVDGTSGTGAGKAGKGCLLIRTDTGVLYINTNTKASPTWTIVGTQS